MQNLQNDENHKINLPKFDMDKLLGGGGKVGTDPANILKEIGIKEGEVVVDFGAGVGFFVMETASVVGPNGRVVAVDINQNLLDALKRKSVESGMRNIYGIRADLEEPNSTKLKDGYADKVLVINLLYLIKDKQAVINEAYRILRSGGTMVIMDWSEIGAHTTIDKESLVNTKDIKNLSQKSGFSHQRSFDAGLSHEVSVFVK